MATHFESQAQNPERVSEAELKLAFERNTPENIPRDPRLAERQVVENERDGQKLILATEMLPRDGKLLQKAWEKAKKKSEKSDHPEMRDVWSRAQEAQAVIGSSIAELKEEVHASFLEEVFSPASRTHARKVRGRIESMLNQAQSKGLVTVLNGRVANRVGFASEWIRELRKLQLFPDLTARQKSVVARVERFFQGVLDGDPEYAAIQKQIDAFGNRPQSEAIRKGKGALRMLGVLAAGGMTLVAGLLDFKNGRLSPYTLAWLGLTGWGLGLYKGHAATVRKELAFVPEKEWEVICGKLDIKGKDGVAFIDEIQRRHRLNTRENREAMKKMLKADNAAKTLNREKYVALLFKVKGVGELQGDELSLAKRLLQLSSQELHVLCSNLTKVRDRTANALLRDFVERGVDSKSAAADMRKVTSDPSASIPSGTPPGNPPRQ